MTDTTISPIATLVDAYLAGWNEADPDRRRELVARAFAEDATYLDPLMSGEGQDGIDAMIAGVQQQFPGHRFELAAGPDAHHDVVRFSWHLVGEGGARVATGIDFGVLAEDGRLRTVTGFLEHA
jgi:SnoaL-like domain